MGKKSINKWMEEETGNQCKSCLSRLTNNEEMDDLCYICGFVLSSYDYPHVEEEVFLDEEGDEIISIEFFNS